MINNTMVDKKYIEAVGRRKTAIARVRLTPAKKTTVLVNESSLDEYFSTDMQRNVAKVALTVFPSNNYAVTVKVRAGGLPAQAEAIRLGTARALIKEDESRRKELKTLGYLKRDPRTKERKKFGLKGARRAPQWSKR